MNRSLALPFDRRRFIKGGAGVAVAGAAAVALRPELAWAAATQPAAGKPTTTGKLVMIFLRGGMDGLSAFFPAGDAAYYTARPTIAVPANRALALDTTFGMHPVLAPLHELYQQKDLSIVHAVGNATESRSHFEAQAIVELGGQQGAGDGWITRHLATSTAAGAGPVRAVALSAISPNSLRGCRECVAVQDVDAFELGGRSGLLASHAATLGVLYSGSSLVDSQGRVGLDALTAIKKLATGAAASAPASKDADAGTYSPLTAALDDAKRLLTGGIGVEVVTVDAGNWDTHRAMGTYDSGLMRDLLQDLGKSIAAFWNGLRTAGVKDVNVLVMSEFGRRIAQNGSVGLDHGSGNMMMVLGSGIAGGGKVLGRWPGLAPSADARGDLPGTTDYRDVIAEVLSKRLGNTNMATVFPGRPAAAVGVS